MEHMLQRRLCIRIVSAVSFGSAATSQNPGALALLMYCLLKLTVPVLAPYPTRASPAKKLKNLQMLGATVVLLQPRVQCGQSNMQPFRDLPRRKVDFQKI